MSGDRGVSLQENEREVIDAERARIGRVPQCGLAISGGGIRSASFGLGVLQGLVVRGALKKVDYLSTVSGGGYIGSSLTWFLRNSDAGTEKKNFPFGKRQVGGRTGEGQNDILDYIRQHASYLTPGRGLNFISLIGITLRSVFVSLLVYSLVITFVMYVLHWLRAFRPVADLLPFVEAVVPYAPNLALSTAVIILALLAALALLFSVRTRVASSKKGQRYRSSIRGQQWTGYLWTGAIFAALVGSLPYAAAAVGTAARQAYAASGSTLLGVILGLFEFRKAHTPGKAEGGPASALRVVVGSAALIYGVLLGAFAFANANENAAWFAGITVAALLFGLVVNLNYVGLHRMYRNRLMETFMPDAESVKSGRWGPAIEADHTPISEMCGEHNPRPYHLVNTNVVLMNSPTSKFKGRGGDNFILSPLYCGSYATGWQDTNDFMKGKSSRGMTLSTAMAISGAAVNPHTGVAGKGLMRNRLVAALMSLLNLRLGYWIRNPKKQSWSFPPNFLVPGLSRGVLGWGFREDSGALELSDGGHFENLGLYELIRRKLPVIIVSDAGADPDFRFGDLENALERVRVDFGAKIRFREEAGFGLEGLLPGSARGSAGTAEKELFARRFRLASRGFAVADITFHDNSTGVLLYVKSTLTTRLPADLYGYKSANPDFPDQTTADQFFDEEQFEVYRELGYQLTNQMLDADPSKQLVEEER